MIRNRVLEAFQNLKILKKIQIDESYKIDSGHLHKLLNVQLYSEDDKKDVWSTCVTYTKQSCMCYTTYIKILAVVRCVDLILKSDLSV